MSAVTSIKINDASKEFSRTKLIFDQALELASSCPPTPEEIEDAGKAQGYIDRVLVDANTQLEFCDERLNGVRKEPFGEEIRLANRKPSWQIKAEVLHKHEKILKFTEKLKQQVERLENFPCNSGTYRYGRRIIQTPEWAKDKIKKIEERMKKQQEAVDNLKEPPSSNEPEKPQSPEQQNFQLLDGLMRTLTLLRVPEIFKHGI